MLLDVECDSERTIFEQPEQRILGPRKARQEMHRLGQYRLAYEQRHVQLYDTLGHPAVIPLPPVDKSDERSGINDGGVHRDRSPQGVRDSSRDPELPNQRRRVRSS